MLHEPHLDRACRLVATIIDHDPRAADVVANLIAIATVMGNQLDDIDRTTIARMMLYRAILLDEDVLQCLVEH